MKDTAAAVITPEKKKLSSCAVCGGTLSSNASGVLCDSCQIAAFSEEETPKTTAPPPDESSERKMPAKVLRSGVSILPTKRRLFEGETEGKTVTVTLQVNISESADREEFLRVSKPGSAVQLLGQECTITNVTETQRVSIPVSQDEDSAISQKQVKEVSSKSDPTPGYCVDCGVNKVEEEWMARCKKCHFEHTKHEQKGGRCCDCGAAVEKEWMTRCKPCFIKNKEGGRKCEGCGVFEGKRALNLCAACYRKSTKKLKK
jgi:hypothetical protein